MRIFPLLILIFSFFIVSANPPELSKKVRKELEKHYRYAEIEWFEIKEISDEKDSFFKVKNQHKELGIVVLSSAKGRYDSFDYLIIYNKSLQIELIKILVYRSEYGSEITGKRWLSQFYNKQHTSLKYGSDVQAISGATFSAMSLTKNINRINEILKEYFADGLN